MARISIIEPLVENILNDIPTTRSDDFILILEVLKTFVTPTLSLEAVFKNHVQLGIPSLETITRCRRKVQEKNPSLYEERSKKIRQQEEEKFKNYARGY